MTALCLLNCILRSIFRVVCRSLVATTWLLPTRNTFPAVARPSFRCSQQVHIVWMWCGFAPLPHVLAVSVTNLPCWVCMRPCPDIQLACRHLFWDADADNFFLRQSHHPCSPPFIIQMCVGLIAIYPHNCRVRRVARAEQDERGE